MESLARRALTAAETLGVALVATARRQAQALTAAEQKHQRPLAQPPTLPKPRRPTTARSKAAAAASEDAARSASHAQDSISRAREALRAARADSSTKIRRVSVARTSGECLPLAATATTAAPAPGLATSDSLPPSTIKADARTKRTGDLDFFQGVEVVLEVVRMAVNEPFPSLMPTREFWLRCRGRLLLWTPCGWLLRLS